jgi:hypothetical protein
VINISSSVQQINQNWQGNLAGTVWQHYQLIDTINPSVTGGPQYPIPVTNFNVNTNILANTTMETYVQEQGPETARVAWTVIVMRRLRAPRKMRIIKSLAFSSAMGMRRQA